MKNLQMTARTVTATTPCMGCGKPNALSWGTIAKATGLVRSGKGDSMIRVLCPACLADRQEAKDRKIAVLQGLQAAYDSKVSGSLSDQDAREFYAERSEQGWNESQLQTLAMIFAGELKVEEIPGKFGKRIMVFWKNGADYKGLVL